MRERERAGKKTSNGTWTYVGVGVGVTTWGVLGVGIPGVDGVRPMGRRGLGRRFPEPPKSTLPGLADEEKQKERHRYKTQ